jgi:hypothetical protein
MNRLFFLVTFLFLASACCDASFMLDCRRVLSKSREPSMKKIIVVGFAILAVSTSGALAKKAAKPKAPAAAAATTAAAPAPVMFGQVSAADRAMYKKNLHDSGMKK